MKKYIAKNWFDLLVMVLNIKQAISTDIVPAIIIHTIGASLIAGYLFAKACPEQ